jgi:hypothetical protein
MYFLYKLHSIIYACSILSLNPSAVLSLLCFSIDLIVLELKEGQSLVFVISLALVLGSIYNLTFSILVVKIVLVI